MARWGNALGGWRKQPRVKGRFGKIGGGSAKKKASRGSVRRSARKTYRKDMKSARKEYRSAVKSSNQKRKAHLKKTSTVQQRYNPYSIQGAEKKSRAQAAHSSRTRPARNTFVNKQTQAINKKRKANGKKALTKKQVNRRNTAKAVAVGAALGVGYIALTKQANYETQVSLHYRMNNLKAHGLKRSDVWKANGGGPAGSVLRGAKNAKTYASMAKNTPSALKKVIGGSHEYRSFTNAAGQTTSGWAPKSARHTSQRAIGGRRPSPKANRNGVFNATSARNAKGRYGQPKRTKKIKNDGRVYVGVVV